MKYGTKIKGFTLAEVLITLVILGVLALILIPTIKNIMPDDNTIKYKKAFYTLQEIITDMVNDSETCQTDDANSFDNPLNYCQDGANARSFNVEVCNRLSTTNDVNCDASPSPNYITTTNGMRWALPNTTLYTGNNADRTFDVVVSLNNENNINIASNRNPNAGIFRFTVNSNGKVIPRDNADAHYLTDDPTK